MLSIDESFIYVHNFIYSLLQVLWLVIDVLMVKRHSAANMGREYPCNLIHAHKYTIYLRQKKDLFIKGKKHWGEGGHSKWNTRKETKG